MDIKSLVPLLYSRSDTIVHRDFHPFAGLWEDFPQDLAPELKNALEKTGIRRLYTHQLAARASVRAGRNPVIVTGVASGKTLCYNLPSLEAILSDNRARALYLFPSKALGQDQMHQFTQLAQALPGRGKKPRIAAYDGDTPKDQRSRMRDSLQVIVTNPDMLHVGILPHHTSWYRFFSGLRYVVLDEVHSYRGIFGSHVANVIRRLKRICAFYRSSPQFICTSATIGNPAEHAGRLLQAPVDVIDRDDAPRQRRHFILFNPKLVNAELGIRRSALQDGVSIAAELLTRGLRVLIFVRSRQMVEITLRMLRERRDLRGMVFQGYRSGYLAEERRRIEQGLKSGALHCVVSTNALEAGIDIGHLDAVVMIGFPGTICSTWQQAGRAGRRERPGLAVLIAGGSPLEQYLMRHPDYFFGQSPEHSLINPVHNRILKNHLRCSAFELPFEVAETTGEETAGPVSKALQELVDAGELYADSRNRLLLKGDDYPSAGVSLRSADPDQVVLLLNDPEGVRRTLGKVDTASARWMVHPGAIYLHMGQMHQVDSLDLQEGNAVLHPCEVDFYTDPLRQTELSRNDISQQEQDGEVTRFAGSLHVHTQVVGYRKIRLLTQEILGYHEIEVPGLSYDTEGFWFVPSEKLIDRIREQGLWRNDPADYGPVWPDIRERIRQRDSFRCVHCGRAEEEKSHDVHHLTPLRMCHSLEFANRADNLVTLCPSCHRLAESRVRVRSGLAGIRWVMGYLAPLLVMCDHGDLEVVAEASSPVADGEPAVILYDAIPGGMGLSHHLYHRFGDLISAAVERVSDCQCRDGCPACVGPGGEAGSGGKPETLALLQAMMQEISSIDESQEEQ